MDVGIPNVSHWLSLMPDDVYEYKVINLSFEPAPDPDDFRKATIESTANRWAQRGWRTVGVMPALGLGYADTILIERKRQPIGIEVDYKGEILRFPLDEVRMIYVGVD
jgi:hypothetical protein